MYKKVLVPLDGSELAECVLPHVEAIAKGCQVAEVTFIRVVEPVTLPIGDGEYLTPDVMTIWTQVESHEKASAEKYLSKLAGQIKYDGGNVKSKVIVGRVAESIANYTTDNEIDLIIIATHGRVIGRYHRLEITGSDRNIPLEIVNNSV